MQNHQSGGEVDHGQRKTPLILKSFIHLLVFIQHNNNEDG